MGIDKTEADCARERYAIELTGRLIDDGCYRLSVSAGGSKGPYMLRVSRLSKARLARVIDAVRAALGE